MWLRGIILDLRYSQDLDNFRRLYPAIDEVQQRLEWELTRNPTIGEPLPVAPDYHVYQTAPFGGVPGFYILYSYDENHITLHSIQPATA